MIIYYYDYYLSLLISMLITCYCYLLIIIMIMFRGPTFLGGEEWGQEEFPGCSVEQHKPLQQ